MGRLRLVDQRPMVLQNAQYAVKEGTSATRRQTGLDEKGRSRFHGFVSAICQTFKTPYWTGKHPCEQRNGEPFQLILDRWFNIIRFLLKISRDSTKLGKVSTGLLRWMCVVSGRHPENQGGRAGKFRRVKKSTLVDSMQRRLWCRKRGKLQIHCLWWNSEGGGFWSGIPKIQLYSWSPGKRRGAQRVFSERVGRVSTTRPRDGWHWSPRFFFGVFLWIVCIVITLNEELNSVLWVYQTKTTECWLCTDLSDLHCCIHDIFALAQDWALQKHLHIEPSIHSSIPSSHVCRMKSYSQYQSNLLV